MTTVWPTAKPVAAVVVIVTVVPASEAPVGEAEMATGVVVMFSINEPAPAAGGAGEGGDDAAERQTVRCR